MTVRIPVCEPVIGRKELAYVKEAVKSGWISSKGPFIKEFEQGLARYVGTKYAVSTSSGTTALHLAIASLGIGKGDEVIIPTFTMIATANAVTYTGAKPVLIDSEQETWNIDPLKIEEKITRRTKAIIVVHIYGHPCNMDPVLEVARRHQLYVVEDAAEAHGAEYKGKKVGSIGDISCFSFYANKIITTGEGGMLLTSNNEIAQKAALLKDQAYEKERRFLHREIGFNYRLTNLQAALGVAQLEKIDDFAEARRRNARIYNSLLEDLECVELPPEADWAKNVYWMYSILLKRQAPLTRDQLASRLMDGFGIDTHPFFVPIHNQPVYSRQYEGKRFEVAENLSKNGINLPSASNLSKDNIRYICSAIKKKLRA